MDTRTDALVALTIRMVVGLPLGAERTRVAQGSTLAVAGTGGVKVTANVGDAWVEVSAGGGVCVWSSVGGGSFAVGIASDFSATFVKAMAAAVDCTSTALIVGTGSAPHALITIAVAMMMAKMRGDVIRDGKPNAVRLKKMG